MTEHISSTPDSSQHTVQFLRRVADRRPAASVAPTPDRLTAPEPSPLDLAAWLRHASPDQLRRHLAHLNHTLRDQSSHRRDFDGGHVRVGRTHPEAGLAYLPPRPELKPALFTVVVAGLQQLDQPADQAALAYYALQNLHLFADGNGRTGRLVYYLLRHGPTSLHDPQLPELIAPHTLQTTDTTARTLIQRELRPARTANALLNRHLTAQLLGEDFARRYGEFYVVRGQPRRRLRQQLSPATADRLSAVLNEDGAWPYSFSGLTMAEFARRHPEIAAQYVFPLEQPVTASTALVPADIGKSGYGFDAADYLDSGQLDPTAVRELLAISDRLKVVQLRTLIDVFTHPDQHLIALTDQTQLPLKDYLQYHEN